VTVRAGPCGDARARAGGERAESQPVGAVFDGPLKVKRLRARLASRPSSLPSPPSLVLPLDDVALGRQRGSLWPEAVLAGFPFYSSLPYLLSQNHRLCLGYPLPSGKPMRIGLTAIVGEPRPGTRN
jgi:hypothetical protein